VLPLARDFAGCVLAGGQSSRMGRDKALIELAGKHLIEHAVIKLKRVCTDVAISSSNPQLNAYAPLVADVHPGCGPLGGMEAALLVTPCEWNLFLPVDVPFLPTAYLFSWLRSVELWRLQGMRAMIFTVDGVPQPTVAVVHRDLRPILTQAIERGEYKLLPALTRAAGEVAKQSKFAAASGMRRFPYWADFSIVKDRTREAPHWWCITAAQSEYNGHWFDNLNTPGDFAEAERHVNALDT
jgi:molybdenum cofactor guanylyltransferase